MNSIKDDFRQAEEILNAFVSDDENFVRIEKAGRLMVESLKNGGKIISCGNGGSMCDAMHFAEELTGQFRDKREPVAAIAISDPSYITCAANDYGFEMIFSRFIRAVGNSGDVLLAISTSGNSVNVVNAAREAVSKSIKVVGLTGKDGGELAALCDVEIRAPLSEYSDRTQEIHIKIVHSLINFIENNL